MGTETVSKATLNAQIFFWNMWSYQKCGFILVGVDAQRKCVTRVHGQLVGLHSFSEKLSNFDCNFYI